MNRRVVFVALLLVGLVGAAGFHLFQRRLSGLWFAFGVHPEVLAQLERSLEDQKRLARLDPVGSTAYRSRFQSIETLHGRLQVLAHSRSAIVERYEILVLALFGGVFLFGSAAWLWVHRRDERRLAVLQGSLGDLAAGRTDLQLHERRRDLIGRIAAMVEETSRVMARDRRRLESLQNLAAWQEAARRHAHEMRTPLTAARLEVSRLLRGPEAESVLEELDRLGRFTQRFASFAQLPRPARVRQDLAVVVAEFVQLFGGAWPGLTLTGPPAAGTWEAAVDGEMIRQVLVNLCDNSAHAAARSVAFAFRRTREGIALEVADDGPGLAPEIRERLFEPYTTTRRIGEGMGLGLAISRKILLDHGGDLELAASSPAGTTFRLLLPVEETV